MLTSHTSHYVDIRLYKPSHQTPPRPHDAGSLQWAFAGKSHTTSVGDGKPHHSVWDHWIDSKSDHPSVDEGDMWPQPNGDVLERGTQSHPITGLECEYEELWADLAVGTAGSVGPTRISIVFQTDPGENSARGLVVRVGDYCQGILKAGDKLTIERWQWIGGEWRCMARIGDGALPCGATFSIEEGNDLPVLQSGHLVWMAVENFRW